MDRRSETSKENVKKARLSPNIGKRGKSKKRLLREEAVENLRKEYEETMRDHWMDILDAEVKDIPNYLSRKDTINQLIGKAQGHVDITTDGEAFTPSQEEKDEVDRALDDLTYEEIE
jgi:hypothetical protein